MYLIKNTQTKDYFHHQTGAFSTVFATKCPENAHKTRFLFLANFLVFLLSFKGFDGYIVVVKE